MNHSSEAEKYCDQKMGADFKPALFVKKNKFNVKNLAIFHRKEINLC